ncbi:MAG: hypothetical protein EBW19_10365 [Betaproteobacteria bacterium]|nr:hypothetical protein [Betaproteobacteria bacterium]
MTGYAQRIRPMKTQRELSAYRGWKQTVRVRWDGWELVAPLEVGPRVLRLGPVGGPNLFFEDPAQLGQTGGDSWKIYGGRKMRTPMRPIMSRSRLKNLDRMDFALPGQPTAHQGGKRALPSLGRRMV